MIRRTLLAAAAAVLLLAGPVLAGGIQILVTASSTSYTRTTDGKVGFAFTIENKGGCFSSFTIEGDADRAGPKLALEKKDGDKWVAVEKPWAKSDSWGPHLGAT